MHGVPGFGVDDERADLLGVFGEGAGVRRRDEGIRVHASHLCHRRTVIVVPDGPGGAGDAAPGPPPGTRTNGRLMPGRQRVPKRAMEARRRHDSPIS